MTKTLLRYFARHEYLMVKRLYEPLTEEEEKEFLYLNRILAQYLGTPAEGIH